jgi:hypothetical protein
MRPVQTVSAIGFFIVMAAVMLAINFIGFAPSYFLKRFFEGPELPFWTHVHGVVFTSWFVLFAGQAVLVRRGAIRLHQRVGRLGAVLAILMVLSGSAILYSRALEYDGSAGSLASTALVVSGNVALLFLFALFLGLGIFYRTRPDWHRRFMLLASLAMMPQALGRFGRLPIPPVFDAVPNEVMFVLGGMLVLLTATWIHDVLRRGRLHVVTGFGCPFVLGMIVLFAVALPQTRPFQDLILWLNGAGP